MGNALTRKRIGTFSGKGPGDPTRSRRGDVVRDTYLPLNSNLEGLLEGASKRDRNAGAGARQIGSGRLVEAFW